MKHLIITSISSSVFIFSLLTLPSIATETTITNSAPINSPANQEKTPKPMIPLAVKELSKENQLRQLGQDLRQQVSKNPQSSYAKSKLGAFLLSQNKASEAIPYYQDAISLDPQQPKLFAALSIAYLHQSRYSMAKAMADEALRLAPDMAQAKKLNEYIKAKNQVIEMTEKASAHSQKPSLSAHQKPKAPNANN